MKEKILTYLSAGFPALWVQDKDEEKAINTLLEVANQGKKGPGKMNSYIWSCTKGIHEKVGDEIKVISNKTDPLAALKYIEEKGNDYSIYIFKNFHFYLNDPSILQKIKDLLPSAKILERHLIFLSCEDNLPPEIQNDITVVRNSLPDRFELELVLDEILNSVDKDILTIEKERIIEASLGLTTLEAENAFALAYVKEKSFNEKAIQIITEIKTSCINRSGILEYIPSNFALNDIGGLDNLKTWLNQRKKAFTPEARQFGLPLPKGILLAGVPGSGKSLTAKAVSNIWGLPLLRFDFGKVFGSLVGETEKKMREVIQTAEAISPCILWIDEIEKALAGSHGAEDSGISARLLGHFLTWMQEKEKPVFVFATANNISALPAEFLRKGRFDEFFFVDLPNETERKEIFSIIISRKKRDVINFNLELLVKRSEGYSGAEIEEAINSGLFQAFSEDRELITSDILQNLEEMRPLSITMKESIDILRKWAEQRAKFANAKEIVTEKKNNKAHIIKI